MDENGEILLLHASNNNTRPFVQPFYTTLIMVRVEGGHADH